MTLNSKQRALISKLTTAPYPKSIAEAAETLGLSKHTAYNWKEGNSEFKAALAEAEQRNDDEAVAQARNVIRQMVPTALAAKAKGLSAKSEHVRHLESTWILERLLGKTADRHEHMGEGGGPIALDLAVRIEQLLDKPIEVDHSNDDAAPES